MTPEAICRPALTRRASAAVIAGALAFSAVAGFWVSGASASQLSWLSDHLLRVGGLGLPFVAGLALGVLLTGARFHDGHGDGGEERPEGENPPSDDIDLELRSLIEEELSGTSRYVKKELPLP